MTQAVNTYCVQDHLCRMKHHSNHVKRYVFISQNELSPGRLSTLSSVVGSISLGRFQNFKSITESLSESVTALPPARMAVAPQENGRILLHPRFTKLP